LPFSRVRKMMIEDDGLLNNPRKRFLPGRRSGQGIVEFALAFPVVLLLVMGIIEGGRLLFIYSTVAAASREAARYGAGIGLNVSGGVAQYKDCTGIRDAAKRVGAFAGVQDGSISIAYDHGPATATISSNCPVGNLILGDRIVVTVTVGYTPVVPLIPFPTYNIVSTNSHTVINRVPVKGTPGTQVVAPTNTAAPATPTPTPTETLAPGAPTNTPVPSTATPTDAPPTPTATPGGQCLTAYYDMEITNPRGQVIQARVTNNRINSQITAVTINWSESGHPKLQNVTIGATTIFNGTTNHSPYTKAGSWDLPMGVSFLTFTFDQQLVADATINLTINNNYCFLEK